MRDSLCGQILKSARLAVCLVAAGAAAAPAQEAPLTADAVVTRGEERVASLADYRCTAETFSRLKDRTEEAILKIWFRKPSLLRIHVSKGRDRGAELLRDASGDLKGRYAGPLRGVTIRLKPDDPRICSLRGVPVTRLAWDEFYRQYRHRAALPGAEAELLPRDALDSPYEVRLSLREGDTSIRETYRIDSQSWLPLQGEVREGERLVERVRFREPQVDSGIEEARFRFFLTGW